MSSLRILAENLTVSLLLAPVLPGTMSTDEKTNRASVSVKSEYRSALARPNRKIDRGIANPDAPKEALLPASDFAKWIEQQYEERFGQSMRR